MTAEEFIKNNPFPKNGKEINIRLVNDIQDPSKLSEKQKNLELLFKNNARLIYIVHKQYNYNQSLDSIMSFVYEGIVKSVETYDPTLGVPFYNYAIKTIRSILQNWYYYNNSLIHVPVMKKKDIVYEYADINDYTEYNETQRNDVLVVSEQEDFSSEMDDLMSTYIRLYNPSREVLEDFKVFNMYRKYPVRDIVAKTGLTENNIKCIVAKTVHKLKKVV